MAAEQSEVDQLSQEVRAGAMAHWQWESRLSVHAGSCSTGGWQGYALRGGRRRTGSRRPLIASRLPRGCLAWLPSGSRLALRRSRMSPHVPHGERHTQTHTQRHTQRRTQRHTRLTVEEGGVGR
jgi:hypothetical protein